MDLSKIVSISGKAGLSKVIAQTKSNLIVESLIDGKKFPAFATYKISTLEDISIYTNDEDVPLKEIFIKIFKKENGESSAVDTKADKGTLVGYFKEILPEYDEERVYPSDIKKVITWYNLLVDKKVITSESLEEVVVEEEETVEESPKPPKKAKTKKVEAKKKDTSEDKPKKKKTPGK